MRHDSVWIKPWSKARISKRIIMICFVKLTIDGVLPEIYCLHLCIIHLLSKQKLLGC